MFEIINNVVTELTNIKSASMAYPPNISMNMNPVEYQHPDININAVIPVLKLDMSSDNKILVSDDGSDSDSEEDSEDDSDEDSEDESDSDSEEDSTNSDEDSEENVSKNQVYVEDIKVVNIDLGDSIEVLDEMPSDTENENVDDSDTPAPVINTDLPIIHVEKLEGIEEIHLEETKVENNIKKETYHNMTMSELKTLVISKGLASNPSKLKKNELIKLLENHAEN